MKNCGFLAIGLALAMASGCATQDMASDEPLLPSMTAEQMCIRDSGSADRSFVPPPRSAWPTGGHLAHWQYGAMGGVVAGGVSGVLLHLTGFRRSFSADPLPVRIPAHSLATSFISDR